MTVKAKTSYSHTETEPEELPHWEDGLAYHKTTTLEEWNGKYVQGAKVKSLDVIIGKVNLLLSLAAVIAFINAAMLILLVAHSTGG